MKTPRHILEIRHAPSGDRRIAIGLDAYRAKLSELRSIHGVEAEFELRRLRDEQAADACGVQSGAA